MPFGDWTTQNAGLVGYNDGNGNVYPSIGLFDPAGVVGTYHDAAINNSICLTMASASGAGTLAAGYCTRAHTALRGRMQAVVMIHATNSAPTHCGICVLQSQVGMQPGLGGMGYALVLETILGQHLIRLVQVTNGISGSPGGALGSDYVVLAESAAEAFSPGAPQFFGLAWESDPVVLKGTRLRVWFSAGAMGGPAFWDFVYTGYVPTASLGVGCLMSYATNTIVTYFDDLEIYGAP